MPYRDGTGPIRRGGLRARGFGYCRSDVNFGPSMGRGMGRGFGQCMVYRGDAVHSAFSYDLPTPEAKKQALANEQKFLESRLAVLKTQMDVFEKSGEETP